MSLRKKRPGKRWVTGIPRAQCQKVIKLLNSLTAAQTRLGGGLPINPAMVGDFNQVKVDMIALLNLQS